MREIRKSNIDQKKERWGDGERERERDTEREIGRH